MSAVEISNTGAVERPSIALPMTAWASNLVGLWPIGLVIAYLERGKASPEVAAQYRYLIRTTWIGAAFFTVSCILCAVLIGYFVMIAVALWWYARCIKAMLALYRREPLRKPGTWLV